MKNKKNVFSFAQAFSRSIGWITPEELEVFRNKKVAIAGMGGVGGVHLLTLTRLGIGAFHVADFDAFEIHNFNRQAGAGMSTLGQAKVDVMVKMARDINPEIKIRSFPTGVTLENIDAFFAGVDVYVDGLDYFAFSARRMVYQYCTDHRIPIVSVGPIAMGGALLNYLPNSMPALEYLDWRASDSEEMLAAKFLVGLTPTLSHFRQLVVPNTADFAEQRGPSTPMACQLCAGIAGTEVMKIILDRGIVRAAPYSLHFDAYTNHMYSRYVWWGNRNPLQRLKIALVVKKIRAGRNTQAPTPIPKPPAPKAA